MEPLIVQCPKTRKPIITGVPTDAQALAKSWDDILRLTCPHCGAIHEVKVRDAYVQGEISEHRLRGRQAC